MYVWATGISTIYAQPVNIDVHCRLHIKVMETELRRLKAEVTTLLGDLKSTEGCIEDLQVQYRAY